MEQMATQVSDLHFLTEAPVSMQAVQGDRHDDPGFTPPNHPGHLHARSPVSATPGDNSARASETPRGADTTNGTKRRSEDDALGGRQQRSKRNRYISIACNECKRRKIKCNGEIPCQRCGNLNLSCQYSPNCCSNSFKDSEEYRSMTAQMARLQEQIDSLHQNMNTFRSESRRFGPSQDHAKVLPLPSALVASPASSLASFQRPEMIHSRAPSFRGSTSMAFSLDVANNTINNMGYRSILEEEEPSIPPFEENSQRATPAEANVEPLYDFGKDEMVRLCRTHEDEVGIMYPVVKIQTVIEHAKSLSAYMDSARRQGVCPVLNDDKTLLLKMVMCCALAVEGHGHSESAAKIYESVDVIINRKLMADGCDFSNLPLLAIVAGYKFLANDEILAWRIMGQVCRLCLEWGIHQRAGLMKIQDEDERKNALNSFWAAYMLDRRWAFGTGLPYVIQDEDIDPELPMPDEYPYLIAMITYSRLGAKVWRQVAHFGPILARELRYQDMDQLDQEILQWYDNVPEEVKLRNWDKEKQMTSTSSYNLQRLRIWTYLRLNQIRIWLYTPILHSATSIMSHFTQAQRVVDLAKDTVRYLSHLNNTTNLYRRLQVFYHTFLTSAIAVLFLASVHAPVRFSTACREEFYMGLELVKDLSAKSFVSQRLWRMIASLKEVAPRIGLRQHRDDDPHNSAALTMAGLASGRISASSPNSRGPFGRPSISSVASVIAPMHKGPHAENAQSPNNGARIQNEMSRIYEGYVGVNGLSQSGSEHDVSGPSSAGFPTPRSGNTVDNLVAPNETTVFQYFREMF